MNFDEQQADDCDEFSKLDNKSRVPSVENKDTMDKEVEDPARSKKGKYPRSVFFIIANEFCERFCYYGMRAALSLFAVDVLLYNENQSIILFHTFAMMCYFFPVFGAILADSVIGKYKTILYLSIIYAIGQTCLSTSAITILPMQPRYLAIFGLLLIAIGSGGIKPCVSAFGGDQFLLPQQESYLSTFFSMFYFSINTGSLLSMFITPILRKDVQCFGATTCYPLAFFVPAILMFTSIVVFFCGRRMYRKNKPSGNVVVKVAKCVSHAISARSKSSEIRDHWLDYADDQYDNKFISDVKATLGVLKMFIPLPLFWALYDQQGSRWTFQATRMDGEVLGYSIKPDHVQVVNPVLIVTFIPIFSAFIYPLLEKFFFVNTELRKLTLGGILGGLAFVISGLIEMKIEPTYAVTPAEGFSQLRIFNTMNCTVNFEIDRQQFELGRLAMWQNVSIPTQDSIKLPYKFNLDNCPGRKDPSKYEGDLEIPERVSQSVALTTDGIYSFKDKVGKSDSGDPSIRALIYRDDDLENEKAKLEILHAGKTIKTILIAKGMKETAMKDLADDKYDVKINGKKILDDVRLKAGGVYTIQGKVSKEETYASLTTVTAPNSVSMLWLLPQYLVMTMGEIMFSVTGLEFAYSQSPPTMKSLLQASWLLTVAFGNLIVVFVAEAHFFERRVYEIFLFAGLMFGDMIIFAVMATFYKYVEPKGIESTSSSSEDIDMTEKKAKM